MIIGYKRVSTKDQRFDRQLEGVELGKVFEEACSGKSADRPVLQECLNFCREGDELHIHSIDRLARSIHDMLNILDILNGKGVDVIFHKEDLRFLSGVARNPMQDFQLHILASVAEFERSLIKERQREGIEVAKAKGKYKGRVCTVPQYRKEDARERFRHGERIASIARALHVSRSTIYRWLEESDDAK